MTGTIKTRRAQAIAKTGAYPRTWQAVLARVPAAVIAVSTAKTLAEIVDAMYAQHQHGHTVGCRDAA